MDIKHDQRKETSERIQIFILLSLIGCLVASIGTFLNSNGYWAIVSTIQIWIICISYLVPYVFRYSKYAELCVYFNITVITLVIASTGVASGGTGGNAWSIYLLLPPAATIVLGKARGAIIVGMVTGTIMILVALMEFNGILPVEILIRRDFFIERLVYQIITMAVLSVSIAIVAHRVTVAINKEIHTKLALNDANNALKSARDLAEKQRLAAEEANTSKSQFLANMSHELRTPLNAIINVTQFVIDGVYTAEELHRVIGNSHHLLGLINDVLDLSKIESGRMDVLYEQLELQPLLAGVHATALGLTKGKGIQVKLEVATDLPVVWSDKKRLRQIVLNLISNAAKFTERGEIVLRAEPDGRDAVRIAVHDTGIGIAVEDQALIFEEFRQVDKGYARRYDGTGLGLPIAKNLVKILGGRMWLESTVGQGSTFSFTLPLHHPKAQAQPKLVAAPAKAIVVVDDDPLVQAELQGYLAAAGYQVHAVLDSRHAISTIREVQPAVVILDILMTERAGFDVLAELKATPELAAIPVLMCSSSPDPRMSLTLGAARHLAKPVQRAQLLAALSEVETR